MTNRLLASRSQPTALETMAAFVLALCLFLPGISNHDLWNPDEARYGEVAREMLVDSSPVIPRLNGELYVQKPPLHFWAIMAATPLTGGEVTEVSTRLSTALAAAASGVLVLLIGHALFGAEPGRLAALAFLTSGAVLWQGRTAQIDMTLTFFVLLSVYGYVRCWLDGRDWGALLFFVSAAFGTMAKGLPALLPPLLSVLVFHLLVRDVATLRQLRIVRGLAVYCGVLLCWLLPATLIQGLEYPRALIVDQSLNRYVAASGHFRPWYYYSIPLFLQSLPFTPLVPAAWLALRRSEERVRYLWPIVWIAVTVAFFSVSSGKRTVYIIALAAPMALLIASGVFRLDRARKVERRLATAGALFSAVVFALVPIALVFVAGSFPEIERLGETAMPAALAVSSILALGCLTALVFTVLGRYSRAVLALALSFGCGVIVFSWTLLPVFDVVKSSRVLARELELRTEPGERYGIYPMPDAGFSFYSKRNAIPLYEEEELYEWLSTPGQKWLLIERDDLSELTRPIQGEEVARDEDWVEGHLLLRFDDSDSPNL